jgi:hypothetical protein
VFRSHENDVVHTQGRRDPRALSRKLHSIRHCVTVRYHDARPAISAQRTAGPETRKEMDRHGERLIMSRAFGCPLTMPVRAA